MDKLAFARRLATVLLSTAGLAGCFDLGHLGSGSASGGGAGGQEPQSGMSPGLQNRAFFGYDCELQCGSLETAALAAGGARAFIVAATPGDRFAAVTSSDPTVAIFTLSGASIDVETGHAGTTLLSLLRADGSTLDSALVTVKDSATLALPAGLEGHAGTVALWQDGTFDFHVTTLDDQGQVTYGTGSVQFTTSGALSGEEGFDGDDFVFGATGSGAGRIVATAPSASAVLDAQLVSSSDLTGLDATIAEGDHAGSFSVAVTANSAAGPVWGVPCVWTANTSGASVGSVTESTLDGPPAEVTQFAVKGAHQASTCAVGGLTTMVAFPST